jgi:hypothetical protein
MFNSLDFNKEKEKILLNCSKTEDHASWIEDKDFDRESFNAP